MASQANKKDAASRRAQVEKLRLEQARQERQRKVRFGIGAGVLVAALVGGLVWLSVSKSSSSSSGPAPTGPAGALAPVWTGLTGQSIDGVSANTSEQLAYHIHAHLAIYINGAAKTVPWGIGIAQPWQTQSESDGSTFVTSGGAFYYLHTHDDTGVIHIESPVQVTYTLGQFFAEWNQKLSANQIGSYTGPVTAYINGTKVSGDPSAIQLTAHEVVQLDLGKNVTPQPYVFASGL
ncbi:MAG TPA: hypothetical protein VGZ32_19835 [Actinocrinis sp.]|jgi:hypothetical protein|uniref:hypothetical protein n=1 Tax=Actinocrinis sp. TaxID=1920516 RepID=UPI002DDD7FEF|nr:hypothetical protein [Actinocrinis sp.]HEV3172606.1 hypothetical protein [Actinocrinis sp.]